MKKQNKLEIIGLLILAIGGLLFLIDKFLKVEFLNPLMGFREIILYSGLAIWALGLMQKENLRRKKKLKKKMSKVKSFQEVQGFLSIGYIYLIVMGF